ncbi:MAG: mechanosensitive ion channel family protein [Spirochaetia bacterium]
MDINEIWENYLLPTIILAGVMAGVFFLSFLLSAIIKKILEKRENNFVLTLYRKIRLPVRFLLVFAAGLAVFNFLSFEETYRSFLKHFGIILIIADFSWLLIRIMDVIEDFVIRRHDITTEDNLEARKMHTQIKYLKRFLIVVIIIIAFSSILMTFDTVRSFGTTILASAGIFSVILGFAAQKTLGTIFAGFQIAITQPVRIDDVVIVEGEWGRIEEITLTYVVVRIWDLRRLILPITYFVENPFQNWTRVSADLLGTVYVYTDYQVDIEAVREELSRLLHENSDWDGKVNILQVTDVKEQTVELRALMSAKNASILWNLRCQIREGLITFCRDHLQEAFPRTRILMDKTSGGENMISRSRPEEPADQQAPPSQEIAGYNEEDGGEK